MKSQSKVNDKDIEVAKPKNKRNKKNSPQNPVDINDGNDGNVKMVKDDKASRKRKNAVGEKDNSLDESQLMTEDSSSISNEDSLNNSHSNKPNKVTHTPDETESKKKHKKDTENEQLKTMVLLKEKHINHKKSPNNKKNTPKRPNKCVLYSDDDDDDLDIFSDDDEPTTFNTVTSNTDIILNTVNDNNNTIGCLDAAMEDKKAQEEGIFNKVKERLKSVDSRSSAESIIENNLGVNDYDATRDLFVTPVKPSKDHNRKLPKDSDIQDQVEIPCSIKKKTSHDNSKPSVPAFQPTTNQEVGYSNNNNNELSESIQSKNEQLNRDGGKSNIKEPSYKEQYSKEKDGKDQSANFYQQLSEYYSLSTELATSSTNMMFAMSSVLTQLNSHTMSITKILCNQQKQNSLLLSRLASALNVDSEDIMSDKNQDSVYSAIMEQTKSITSRFNDMKQRTTANQKRIMNRLVPLMKNMSHTSNNMQTPSNVNLNRSHSNRDKEKEKDNSFKLIRNTTSISNISNKNNKNDEPIMSLAKQLSVGSKHQHQQHQQHQHRNDKNHNRGNRKMWDNVVLLEICESNYNNNHGNYNHHNSNPTNYRDNHNNHNSHNHNKNPKSKNNPPQKTPNVNDNKNNNTNNRHRGGFQYNDLSSDSDSD